MNIATLSNYIILILIIVLYGLKKKTKVYIDFVDGAKDGFATVIKVMPTLIGLMVAVGMLRESGAMDFCGKQIGKVTKYIGFPGELVPLNIVKIFYSYNSLRPRAIHYHFLTPLISKL